MKKTILLILLSHEFYCVCAGCAAIGILLYVKVTSSRRSWSEKHPMEPAGSFPLFEDGRRIRRLRAKSSKGGADWQS
jgi:hypothetical protein